MKYIASPKRRRFVGRVFGAAAGALAATFARPVAPADRSDRGEAGRMDADERERLRRELREQGGRDQGRKGQSQDRGDDSDSGSVRLSEEERKELRRQLREAGRQKK